MTYTHLTTEELVMIEAYFHQKISVLKIATYIGRSRQTIHNVVTFLRKGYTALDYFKQYKGNKKRCGRHPNAPCTDSSNKGSLIKQFFL